MEPHGSLENQNLFFIISILHNVLIHDIIILVVFYVFPPSEVF